jgi:hypothetical protein
MWVIVKLIENEKGVKMPVVILDGHGEIWEFSSLEEAENMRQIFQENSDSGYDYIVRKI